MSSDEWIDKFAYGAAMLEQGRIVGRREAFQESARVCSGYHHEQKELEAKELLGEDSRASYRSQFTLERAIGAKVCENAILALADLHAPDCDWRDRPPEAWEVEAHDGPWARLDRTIGWPFYLAVDSDGAVFDDDKGAEAGPPPSGQYRPLAADLHRAPWPTKDAE